MKLGYLYHPSLSFTFSNSLSEILEISFGNSMDHDHKCILGFVITPSSCRAGMGANYY